MILTFGQLYFLFLTLLQRASYLFLLAILTVKRVANMYSMNAPLFLEMVLHLWFVPVFWFSVGIQIFGVFYAHHWSCDTQLKLTVLPLLFMGHFWWEGNLYYIWNFQIIWGWAGHFKAGHFGISFSLQPFIYLPKADFVSLTEILTCAVNIQIVVLLPIFLSCGSRPPLVASHLFVAVLHCVLLLWVSSSNST